MAGNGTVKTCARCGQPMAVRRNKVTREDFLGCTAWPECEHTERLPVDVLLRHQSLEQPMSFPGFGGL